MKYIQWTIASLQIFVSMEMVSFWKERVGINNICLVFTHGGFISWGNFSYLFLIYYPSFEQ